jgi:hypothetical protein
MSFLKSNGPVSVILGALAVMAVSSQVARAETLFLNCGDWGIFTVDLTKDTVNNVPTNITPLSIDWTNTQGDFPVSFRIDRVAGALTAQHHESRFGPITCALVSQPPTKF